MTIAPSLLKTYKDALALDYPDLDPSLLDFILHVYKESQKDDHESTDTIPHRDQPPEAHEPEPAAEGGPADPVEVPEPGAEGAAA